MKTRFQIQSKAFTLVETLIVIVVLLLLVAILLPALAPYGGGPPKFSSCANQLKQIGLAARIWSGDNGDRFPMAVSTNQGGSMESAFAGDVALTFQVMSNELSTPKLLVCPADSKRNSATNFLGDFNRMKTSYFVGVDATQTNATMLLFGDRNITNGTRLHGGLLELTDSKPSGWTKEIHNGAGMIALSDGSMQQVPTPGLREAIRQTGVATNRLAIP